MKKFYSKMMLLLLLCAIALPLKAGTLNLADVPTTAKWAVHLDFDSMRSTKLTSLLIQEPKVGKVIQKSDKVADFLGFNPLIDLHSATLYSPTLKPKVGVIIVKGTFDEARLLELLQKNSTLESATYGDHVTYTWFDHGNDHFGCFYKDDEIVIASNKSLLEAALDVLDGNVDNLTAGGDLDVMTDVPAGTSFIACATGYEKFAKRHPKALCLTLTDRILVVAGEKDGESFLGTIISAKDLKKASEISSVVNGLISFGKLIEHKSPMISNIAKIARVELIDDQVEVWHETSAENVYAFLTKLKEMKRIRDLTKAEWFEEKAGQ